MSAAATRLGIPVILCLGTALAAHLWGLPIPAWVLGYSAGFGSALWFRTCDSWGVPG